jgi:Undecaprenyl-phosphate galactose phosphotransferase WbaP
LGSARSASIARFARVAVLVAGDVLVIGLALGLAYAIWARGQLRQPESLYLPLWPAVCLFPLLYAGARLYPGFGLGPVETLRRLSARTTAGYVLFGAATFAFKVPQVYSRVTLSIAWVLSLFLVPLGRALVNAACGRRAWWPEPVLVVGEGRALASSLRRLETGAGRGYRPVGVLTSAPQMLAASRPAVPVVGRPDEAEAFARVGVQLVLVVEGPGEGAGAGAGPWLQQLFRHVVLVREDAEFGVEHAEVRNVAGLLGVEHTNQLLMPHNRFVKRALDLVLGSAALLLAAPIVLLCGVLIKLWDRGPVFFVQEREGLAGRRIRVRKLRTMRVDAQERLEAHLAEDPEARMEWETRYKLTDDPRVIPVLGRVLRRFSIDELPQLAGVVAGSLSLVGPRPFPDYHLARFPETFRALRRKVRPGVTGWWQVTVRSEGGVEDQQALDTYYIRNWSLWMDLYILARTAGAVLGGRGAR